MATTHAAGPRAQRSLRLTRRELLAALLFAGGGASLLAACGGTGTTALTAPQSSSASSSSSVSPSTAASSAKLASSSTSTAVATEASSAVTTGVPATAVTADSARRASIRLTIMSESGFNDGWSPAFWQSYSKADPAVAVGPEPQTCGNCDDKFTSLFAAATPPDLIITGGNGMVDRGIAGAVTALNDRIAPSKTIRTANFIPRAVDEGSWQGKVYGLYWSGAARMLFWNKDLFQAAGLDPEQPPQTWDDFTAAMQKLTKTGSDVTITQLGINPTYDSVGAHYWEAWFWELGGSYLSADGTKVTIANDMGASALDWMVKQSQVQGGWDKITAYWTAASKDAGKNTSSFGWGFGLQKVAMFIEVGDAITSLQKLWPSVRYGIGGIPAAATGKRASVRGGYYWVIPSKAAHPDTAWDYMEWSFTLDQTLAYNNHYNRIPTANDAVNSAKWLPDNPTARKVSSEVVAYSQRIPCIAPGYADILTVNGGIPGPVLLGKQTPQVALQNAQTQIQGILDKALHP